MNAILFVNFIFSNIKFIYNKINKQTKKNITHDWYKKRISELAKSVYEM